MTSEAPTDAVNHAAIDSISADLVAPPSINEVDAHIGSLHRENARLKLAYQSLLDHAGLLEAKIEDLLYAVKNRGQQIVFHKETIASLKSNIEALAETHGTEPASDAGATSTEAPAPTA